MLSKSFTQFIGLILMLGSLTGFGYFGYSTNIPFSRFHRIENGQIKYRRFNVIEQILAVASIISLCIGLVIWCW